MCVESRFGVPIVKFLAAWCAGICMGTNRGQRDGHGCMLSRVCVWGGGGGGGVVRGIERYVVCLHFVHILGSIGYH